jgi:hypothetical protein
MAFQLPSAVLTLLLLTASAAGLGAVVLRLTIGVRDFRRVEFVIWAFTLGIGGLGWVGFFLAWAGLLSPAYLIACLVIFLPGLWFVGHTAKHDHASNFGGLERLLWAFLFLVLSCDLIEGMAPPTDADSLAYHFANVKLFALEGRLIFIPRANTGAVPMLQHMTYLMAYGLGGELGMTLWTAVSGWALGGMVYVISRRSVSSKWAVLLAVVILTTPAVIYGAGSGQVESRNAAFALAGAFALAHALRTGNSSFAVLAGLAAGFYCGSKYTGLLFVFICGLMLLAHKNRWSHIASFSIAALIAGGQWYFWNFLNIGDPVFPILSHYLPYTNVALWPPEQADFYKHGYAAGEYGVRKDFISFLMYPFWVTFSPMTMFEAGRVGFGPLIVLLIPFALLALKRVWRTAMQSSLFVHLILAIVGYALWFALGPSLRVRFLLPLYPLLLIVLSVAAIKFIEGCRPCLGPLLSAFIAVAAMQAGAQVVFTLRPFLYLTSERSRSEYLNAQIGRYAVVEWVNANLQYSHKVLTPFREQAYLFNVPFFSSNPIVEARIDTRPINKDTGKFWRQLQKQGITHIIFDPPYRDPKVNGGLTYLIDQLTQANCLTEVYRSASHAPVSRTMGFMPVVKIDVSLLALQYNSCRL